MTEGPDSTPGGATPGEPARGLGATLQRAREAQGISREALAHELNMPPHLLEALEREAWDQVPPGRERPLLRLVARRLGVDLSCEAEAWEALPGGLEQEPPDPRRERMERLLMGGLSIASVALLAWLVIPGRNLKGQGGNAKAETRTAPPPPWNRPRPEGPCPVLGEVLPEPPITPEGILVNLRAMDTCTARIQPEEGQEIMQVLRVSEPWRLRVKGPFLLSLDNAGVVSLEVAGRRVRHGASVAEAWNGRFDEEGRWILPKAETETPLPSAPETEPGNPVEEE